MSGVSPELPAKSPAIRWLAVFWVVAGILSFPPLALNVMAFDAPGSADNPWTFVWVLGLIAISPLAVLGGILAFLTRRALFLWAPSLGVAAWIVGSVPESLAR